MKTASKPHISPVDTRTRPRGDLRFWGLPRGSYGVSRAFGDYRRMKPVKIVPDDHVDVYMYLVMGIAIGYALAVITGG